MRTGRRPLGAFTARLLSGALALAVVAATPAVAPAQTVQQNTAAARPAIALTIDQAMVMRFPSEARSVIIGNPAIADATILDTTLIVITGRSFGTTNIIVLGDDGRVIAQELLTVQANNVQLTVYRRSVRETYSCTPICERVLQVGDEPTIFDLTAQQLQTRGALAAGGP